VDASERDLFAKAQALLGSLPPGTDPAVRKQIVEASLKAFGYPVEQIIQAGVAEINALQAYIEFSHRNTQRVVAETSARIEGLEKEIADLRSLIEQKAAAQQAVASQSNQQKLRVQEVLEFFGQETVERVLRESPKPVEPAGQ
jgi:TolA-binding protein